MDITTQFQIKLINKPIERIKKMDWKDKRIQEINEISKKNNWDCSDNNKYFEEVQLIYKSDAKTLDQFKKESETK